MFTVVVQEIGDSRIKKRSLDRLAQCAAHQPCHAIADVSRDDILRKHRAAEMMQHGIDRRTQVRSRINQCAIEVEPAGATRLLVWDEKSSASF